jgi:REP-associated tyrosine transposase
MARKPRRAVTGYPHHVVNRGNDRRRLFFTHADYDSFLHLMVVGKARYAVKIYGVALMPNHFHAVVVPEADTALSGYLQWVAGSYASHLRARTNTTGHGHVFQRRFWSDPILGHHHFLSVLRYIEANPREGQLVNRCEEWPWTSAALRTRLEHPLLDPLPIVLPRDWPILLDLPQPAKEVEAIRRAMRKNRRRHTSPPRVDQSSKCD